MPRHCSHRKGNLSQHLDINWFVFPAKAQLSLKHFCEGIAKKKILIKPIKTTTKKTLPNLFVCNCWSPVSEWSVYSYVGDRLRCTYGVIILVSHQLPHYYKPPFPLPNAKHTLYVASVVFVVVNPMFLLSILHFIAYCWPFTGMLIVAPHILSFLPHWWVSSTPPINNQPSTITDQPDRCLLVDCRQEHYNA